MIENINNNALETKELNPKENLNPDFYKDNLDKKELIENSNEDLNPDFYKENLDKKELIENSNEDLNPDFYKENLDKHYDENIIKNKEDGLRRENDVETDLRQQYPEKDGYNIESEVYLRDKDGNIVKDEKTGEARRIDFVVTKDGKAVDSIEVTSKTADKTEQLAKEERIRKNGGNYA